MSEVLNIHEYLKFQSKISFSTEGCLNYLRRQNSREVFITFSIPCDILIRWRELKVLKKLPVSYVELLYLSQSVPGCFLKEEAKVRVEKRLAELCSSAASFCSGISGSKRVKRRQQVKKLAIHRHEVQDVNNLLSTVQCLEKENAELQEKVKTLENKCESLLKEVADFTKDVHRLAELEESFMVLSDENNEFQEYVQKLLDKESCNHCDHNYTNKGATYDQVSYTQKRRKLKELKTKAETALWFLETFGFKLDKLSLTDLSGDKVSLEYNGATKSAYHSLSEEEKDKVKNVVHIMDAFCVSDAAYHELSMTEHEGLPRSYLIKQCRQDLNKLYSISRTPGEWPGAQLSFMEELHYQLSKQVNYI